MADYNIKDLEKLSGILAHTIRIWEKRYNIFSPDRTDTNRRRYSDSDLRKIINISILNRNGFKISKIAAFSESEIEEKVAFLSADAKQTNTQIESLIIAMIELDERRFNDILTRTVMSEGLESTFDDIVFPFLKRIGTLWTTGSIYPAQEHFVSNILRQKLIAAIDSQFKEITVGRKKILFFLPENELHELGLLYLNYLAVKGGHEVLYLGQLTPFESVEYATEAWNPSVIVTGTLTSFANINENDFVMKMARSFKGKTIVLTGLLATIKNLKAKSNIYQISNAREFIDILNTPSE